MKDNVLVGIANHKHIRQMASCTPSLRTCIAACDMQRVRSARAHAVGITYCAVLMALHMHASDTHVCI